MLYWRSNLSLILLPPPGFCYCLPGPANLPSSCYASGLAGNDSKELRVSRKHQGTKNWVHFANKLSGSVFDFLAWLNSLHLRYLQINGYWNQLEVAPQTNKTFPKLINRQVANLFQNLTMKSGTQLCIFNFAMPFCPLWGPWQKLMTPIHPVQTHSQSLWSPLRIRSWWSKWGSAMVWYDGGDRAHIGFGLVC